MSEQTQAERSGVVLVAVTANGTVIRDGQFDESDGDRLVRMVALDSPAVALDALLAADPQETARAIRLMLLSEVPLRAAQQKWVDNMDLPYARRFEYSLGAATAALALKETA